MELHSFVDVLESVVFPERHCAGLTTDLPARLVRHNEGRCRHTAKFRPWRILVSIEFADAARAADFERYLKSGSGREFARRHF